MPFLMIRNDITKVAADAIVNPANRNLLQGSGTSRAIYQAAGEQELTASCGAIGRCDLGRAVCTPAFGLPAKYIFHAVCPAWHGGGFGEAEQLAGAYHSALELAAEYHCESVAFPLLSSGNYDLNRTCDEIRPGYHHVENCQQTVPEAIIAFLESVSFEDALRNAVSLGGDSDTLACITGGIAEAFYGMPQELRDETLKRLPEDIREGYELFRWNIGQR
jgi:O-acetyl-ADP-ribose deacetylase (regulator of RNase III)